MTDIICFPDATWDAPLWTNRQHMMLRLARTGAFRILYVNPPALSAVRALVRGKGSNGLLEQPEAQLWVLHLPLPAPNRIVRNRLPQVYDALTLLGTRIAARRLGFERPMIWSYSPFVANYLHDLAGEFVIYDCVDRYPQLPFYAARGEQVRQLDAQMTQQADVVLCTSRLLYEEKQAHNPRCYLVGNAADVELFGQARSGTLPVPAELQGIPKPIIGFHGALDNHRIDYDLLRTIARTRPDWSLVLIGPQTPTPDLEWLTHEPNVRLIGKKALHELPPYVAQYDVAMLPYRLTDYVRGLSPLKIYEYLAAGKPVVAVPVPHITAFDVVRIAPTPAAFIAQIEAALTDTDAAAIARRVEVAAQHSWEAKLRRVLELVPELHGAAVGAL
ncbi:MAG: glycosyltransferase family 1 protein [Chloroflexaceae bacterium]|nr:glycosyltransferase family 1 protein [Chloroflexaceae bacterium]